MYYDAHAYVTSCYQHKEVQQPGIQDPRCNKNAVRRTLITAGSIHIVTLLLRLKNTQQML